MKILMTADTVGGVWTYALDLARALGALDIEVALATMGALLSKEQRLQADAIPNLTVYPSGYKLEWMEDPWEDVHAAGEWLLGLEDLVKPDVIHLNGFAHGALPWKAPTMIVGHSDVLSWWRAVKDEDAPPSWDRYRQAVSRGLLAANMVIAPTGAMLLALVRHYGLLRNARVIHNGRDASQFTPREKEDFIFSAGRLWDEAKNLSTLDQAAAGLPWPVLVAGDTKEPKGGRSARPGAPSPGAQPTARNESSGKNGANGKSGRKARTAKLLGKLPAEDVAERMSRASIYALPARYEPFGLSALEAALSGCALVLGDIPSLREVWGDAALYVPPDDPEALHATLAGLIEDQHRREQMAGRARFRAFNYGLRHMAEDYHAAYRDLVNAGWGGHGSRLSEMALLRKGNASTGQSKKKDTGEAEAARCGL